MTTTMWHRALWVLCACLTIPGTTLGEHTVKKCFNGQASQAKGEVTLSCPEGSGIHVDEAMLGRNEWGACLLTEEDCVDQTSLFQECQGLTECTHSFKAFSPRCGYSTLLVLTYSCVQFVQIDRVSTQAYATTTRSSSDETTYKQSDDTSDDFIGDVIITEKDDDSENIGLIVVCVIATIVTVIMLIIAIALVIRRLLQYYRRDRGGRSSRLVSCVEASCAWVEVFPCFREPPIPPPNDGMQGGDKQSLSRPGDTRKNQAKDRVAPIGEESEDVESRDSPCSHNEAVEMADVEVEVARRSYEHQERNSSFKTDDETPNTRVKNDNNWEDKISSWKEKEIARATADSKNNNDKIRSKNLEIQNTAVQGNADPVVENSLRLDAVAIPNTEVSSSC